MNLAQLRGSVTKNKVAIGALGAVAVAGLAWRARKSGGNSSSTTPAATTPGASSSAPVSSPAGYTATTTGYDSTASDVYNAIQPQLEDLRNLVSTIPVPGTPTTPAPAPAPSDPRREAITADYQTILNRTPGLGEVNFWDATGFSEADIRQRIVSSDEARAK